MGDRSTRRMILREMGLAPIWRLRRVDDTMDARSRIDCPAERQVERVAGRPDGDSMPLAGDDRAAIIARLDWQGLIDSIANCRACSLCQHRKQPVPGVGDVNASWLFVGEGPGAEEDARGEPFVGQAGKLLDAMLSAIGLRRDHAVYIANAVKCRPPDNRAPTSEELTACRPYLERQVALLQPRLIVALGRPAAQTLLGRDVKISAVRGEIFDCHGCPLVVTYHPAYLLRTPLDKARAWEDLCLARRIMSR